MYKIRIILDSKEDVIRTLSINPNCNLENLHHAIANAFGFDGSEMASFYRTDDEWNQGEEIPLFNMSEFGETSEMKSCILNATLPEKNDKLIYVYDFLHMWTFYVEVIDISNQSLDSEQPPKIILSVGNIPEQAPEKSFKAENISDDFTTDGLDETDSFDDMYFNDY